MFELNIFSKLIFVAEILEILMYFLRTSIHRRPGGIGLKAPGVDMRRNITRASGSWHKYISKSHARIFVLPWISILEPRPRDSFVLFVDNEFKVFERSLQFVCKDESRGTCADAYDSQSSFVVNWLVRSGVGGLCKVG